MVRPFAVLPLGVLCLGDRKDREWDVLLRHYARPGPPGHLKERCRQNLSPGLGGLWPPGGRFEGDGVRWRAGASKTRQTPKRERRQNAKGGRNQGVVRNAYVLAELAVLFVMFVLFRRSCLFCCFAPCVRAVLTR